MRPARPRDAVRDRITPPRPRRSPRAELGTDLLFLAGVLLIGAGVGWIYRPLGLLELGAAAIAIAWQLGRAPAPARPLRDDGQEWSSLDDTEDE